MSLDSYSRLFWHFRTFLSICVTCVFVFCRWKDLRGQERAVEWPQLRSVFAFYSPPSQCDSLFKVQFLSSAESQQQQQTGSRAGQWGELLRTSANHQPPWNKGQGSGTLALCRVTAMQSDEWPMTSVWPPAGGDGLQSSVNVGDTWQRRHVPDTPGHVELPGLLHRHASVRLPPPPHSAASRKRQGLAFAR